VSFERFILWAMHGTKNILRGLELGALCGKFILDEIFVGS
jgi:hypothetical protein